MSPSPIRTALTIAGSDSGGGAGIQADIKSFSANGVYAASIITALTAQNTLGVQAILDVPPEFICQQLDSVFGDLAIHAVKIGMLSQTKTIEVVAERLRQYQPGNIVLDPVMVATSGDSLLDPGAIEALSKRLIPLACVITPNLAEAAALLGAEVATTEPEMIAQAQALLRLGAKAVLLKGGHGEGAESVDFLVIGSRILRLAAPRHATRNTHGTGCTLSAALAANLAKGEGLEDAAHAAKAYVTKAIAAADRLAIGHGNGPTHHFVDWW